MKELTTRQRKVFEFIREFISKNDRSPTMREICAEMNIVSTFGVLRHLNALEKKGFIKRDAGTARGIRLAKQYREVNGIPLVGRIAAGAPITAIENIEGHYSMGAFFGDPKKLFLLEVKGDSMVDAGIFNGDMVVVHKQARIENGEIGVAIVNDEATVKKISVSKHQIKLIPQNPKFKPMVYDAGSNEVSVAGKVIGVIRRIR